jgi:phosphoribosylanthranilate isomerase
LHVRIKICGITNPADANLAADLGADMVGLNFYPPSPRFIDHKTAAAIRVVLPPTVTPVALFVNESPENARARAESIDIKTIQMYGEHREPLPATGVRWIPAFNVRDASSLRAIVAYVDQGFATVGHPYAILVDAHAPGQYGGTGQTAPWHLLADFHVGPVLIFLAGGLTPENVADAIRIVKPYAVDVASGVESAPGKKDSEKMRRFIDAVRNASV